MKLKFKIGDILIHATKPEWTYQILSIDKKQYVYNFRILTGDPGRIGCQGQENIDLVERQARKISKLDNVLK